MPFTNSGDLDVRDLNFILKNLSIYTNAYTLASGLQSTMYYPRSISLLSNQLIIEISSFSFEFSISRVMWISKSMAPCLNCYSKTIILSL